MLNKPTSALPQACLGASVKRARTVTHLKWHFQIIGSVYIQNLGEWYCSGNLLWNKLLRLSKVFSLVILMDGDDQTVGWKLPAFSVDGQKLKLLMTISAWLLSLLNQWSKGKIRWWLQWSCCQFVKECKITSTFWSCCETSLVTFQHFR